MPGREYHVQDNKISGSDELVLYPFLESFTVYTSCAKFKEADQSLPAFMNETPSSHRFTSTWKDAHNDWTKSPKSLWIKVKNQKIQSVMITSDWGGIEIITSKVEIQHPSEIVGQANWDFNYYWPLNLPNPIPNISIKVS